MSPATGIAVLLIVIGGLLGYASLKSFRVATPAGIILGAVSSLAAVAFIAVAVTGLLIAHAAAA
jgi:uncharacterized membrane protein (UPF0136 family)